MKPTRIQILIEAHGGLAAMPLAICDGLVVEVDRVFPNGCYHVTASTDGVTFTFHVDPRQSVWELTPLGCSHGEFSYVIGRIDENGVCREWAELATSDEVAAYLAMTKKVPDLEQVLVGGFELEMLTEQQIAAETERKKQSERMAELLARPLKGNTGDLTADMFGEGQTPLFNERRDLV